MKVFTIIAVCMFGLTTMAQTKVEVPPHDSLLVNVRTSDFPQMKEMVNVPIPGAPILGIPQRIDGVKNEIRTEFHGLIYPCHYDWNKDGKPDLLLGEFETGMPGIRVYLNKGSRKKPKYSGEYFYATDINGDTLQTYQWCCIGFHPQIVDLNNDGYDDIISGQYYPGKISWWRGSEKGFLPCQFIDQLFYEEGKNYNSPIPTSPMSHDYWNYTTARMADFNGDGLLDLFVGGNGGYRVALNIGTAENPKFGIRELLYHVDGSILYTYRDSKVDISKRFVMYEVCGDGKAIMTPVDWDNDGVLDILSTVSYTDKTQDAIYFFRGVETQDGLRFEHAKPLVVAKDGSKLFPGTCPQIYVCDYNNDGVNDLLLGLSIETIGKFEGAKDIYWEWLHDLHIQFPGKDAGRNFRWYKSPEELFRKLETEKWQKEYMLGKLDDMKYITLRHRGYPFVMYGEKNPLQAVALKGVAQRKEYDAEGIPTLESLNEPVTCIPELGLRYFSKRQNMSTVNIRFLLQDGYHLYSSAEVNRDFIPTTVELELPDGLFLRGGKLTMPDTVMKGMNEIYAGNEVLFSGMLQSDLSKFDETTTVDVKVKIRYQTCNSEKCMPPVDIEKIWTITIEPNKK